MDKWLGTDGIVTNVISKAMNLVVLNVLFLICCIPIVTIGASISSMYAVCMKMCGDEESYISSSFLKGVKGNFKEAALPWLLEIAVIILLYLEIWFSGMLGGKLEFVFKAIFMAAAIVLGGVFAYVFPLIAKFRNSMKNTLKNALFLSAKYIYVTIPVLMLNLLPLVCLMLGGYFMLYGIPIFLIIGFSLSAYIQSFWFRRIFAKYIESDESSKGQDTYDE